jgi:membrane protein YqaA with SNARE-associated domain
LTDSAPPTPPASAADPPPAGAGAMPPASVSGALPPHTRAWFAFFLAWMLGWAAVALLAARGGADASPQALRVWVLALMCFYLALCNSFVPLPTTWIVLLAASDEFALVQAPWLRVPLVAGLATVATVVANLTEYHLLAFLLRYGGMGARVRRTRLFGWATRWFNRSPFQILLLVAFFPLPIDAIRWLAVLQHYSRTRFALAYLLGRGPRYLIFAGCAVLFALSGKQILLIQVGLLAVALVGRLVWPLVRGKPREQRGFPINMS